MNPPHRNTIRNKLRQIWYTRETGDGSVSPSKTGDTEPSPVSRTALSPNVLSPSPVSEPSPS